MITYERADNGDIKVRIGQTLTGRIKLAKGGGYYYLPSGQRQGGKVYPTSELVKRSLETDTEFEMRFCEECKATIVHDLVDRHWQCRGVLHRTIEQREDGE